MHPYSSDAPDRKTAPAIFGIASVAVTWAISRVLEITGLVIPWWIGTPTVMGLFALSWSAYDTFAWRFHIGPIRLSVIPDLRGTWVGTVTSSHDDGRNEKPAVFWVQQHWSRILLRLETDHSRSRSTMAALCSEEANQPGLTYEYINEPRALSDSRMHAHRGSACLRVDALGTKLTGDYYAGRDRLNVGELTLRRVSVARLGFEAAMAAAKAGG
jgi:hypothetical protein